MRITRLRVTGFKSFVEPAELRIEPGLTGIVGPNGCGKSNLLEAIRWVMGESSAKSMRAGGMDDVIFAGTSSRPSRDFAEVALVCDSEDAPLPGVVAEATSGVFEVVRRIERGAGSAYRANGQDVRARDIALIFADAATGAHSPALVSQGKVAAIVAAKPQERRLLLEEAAGIAGLHVRRREAEQKLRATETNLARLSDLLVDMDARAGQLRRQARAAERYTWLSDHIRTAEARMIFSRWRDSATVADAARAAAAAATEAVARSHVRQQGAADKQNEAMIAVATARDAVTREREADIQLSGRLKHLRTEAQMLDRRIADLFAEQVRIAQDRDAEDALARESAAAIEFFDEQNRRANVEIAKLAKTRPELERRAMACADALRDSEVALAQARAEAANENAERRIAEAAHGEASRRMGRIEDELARIDAEAASAGDSGSLAAASQQANTECAIAEAATNSAEADVAMAGLTRAAAAEAQVAAETALAEVRAALAALDSEAAALDRSLAASAGNDAAVVRAIRVEPGYEAAIAAVLGDDLSAPLLDSTGAGLRGWSGAVATGDDPILADGLTPLAAYVIAPVQLERRLAQVGVVDVDAGQPLKVGQRLVTLTGMMRRWDGFVASGDGAATAERLARANRREAISQQRPAVESGAQQIVAAAIAASDRLTAADVRLLETRRNLADTEAASRKARRAADGAEAALVRHASMSLRITERRGAVASEREDAATALDEAMARLSALPDGSGTVSRLAACDGDVGAARATLTSVREEIAALDRHIANQRERQIEAQAELRSWNGRASEAARRLSAMVDRLEQNAAEQARLVDTPNQIASALVAAEAKQSALQSRLTSALLAERTTADALAAADTMLDIAREELAAAREGRAGAAVRAENAESRRIEMGRISGERFACPPPLLPEKVGFLADEVGRPQEESTAHEQLNQDRERIGPVNLVAAQELAEIEGEQAASTANANELTQAVNRLHGSIGHLNREGRARLLQAFTVVDSHFRSLFSTLFGGGQAHLALVESDDPLEAGLEIMAQPPGKKLSSLTLLSGGEQALTAVALIFALFLTSPAPICVLDEVDAPLDDANVERFCDLLDRMVVATTTRYLIVTHNAVTMARMHRLFGVTMVEPGVSRLVSVDLGRAGELLAAE